MADLIDRQAFIEDIKTEIMNLYLDGMKGTPRPREELYNLIDRINEQPAVDAVEVVRCKDCKYRMLAGRAPFMYHRCAVGNGLASALKDDDYCSYGERREDDAAD